MNIAGRSSLLVVTLATGALALGSSGARAQHEHGHEHDSGPAAIVNLKLDGGEKWATDATLRKGMAEIHAAFEADHPTIHAGKETDAQYEALAGRIESTTTGDGELPTAMPGLSTTIAASTSDRTRAIFGDDLALTVPPLERKIDAEARR